MFLGVFEYYHQFIPNYSNITALLFNQTHKDREFNWGLEEDKAFNQLKEIITLDTMLIYLDFSKQFHIFLDACKDAIGAILCQEVKGKFKPIE